MTAEKLIFELRKLPKNCEICIRDITINWQSSIHAAEPIDGPETCEDGTPIAWIQTE